MEIGVPAPVAGRVRDVFVARNVQVDAGDRRCSASSRRTAARSTRSAAGASGSAASTATGRRRTRCWARSCSATTSTCRKPAPRSPPVVGDARTARPLRRPGRDRARAARPRRRRRSGAARAPGVVPALARHRAGGPAVVVRRGAGEGRRPLRRRVARPRRRRSRRRCCGMFVSQQRRDEQLPIVLALLDEVAAHVGDAEDLALRESLDRLIERTRRRYPEVAVQARNVRYRVFDRPHVERVAGETSARMRSLSAALAGPRPRPGARRRARRLPAAARADPRRPTTCSRRRPTPGGLIEVLAAALLQDPRAGAGRARRRRRACATSYGRHERTVHVLATRVEDDDLGAALRRDRRRGQRRGRAGHGRRRPVPGPAGRHARRPRRPVGAPRRGARGGALPGARAARHAGRVAPRRRHRGAHVPPARRVGRAAVLDGRGRWQPGRPDRRSRRTSRSAGCTR